MKKLIAAGVAGVISLATLAGCASATPEAASSSNGWENLPDADELSESVEIRKQELKEQLGPEAVVRLNPDTALFQQQMIATVPAEEIQFGIEQFGSDNETCMVATLPEVDEDAFRIRDVDLRAGNGSLAGWETGALFCLKQDELDGRLPLPAVDEDFQELADLLDVDPETSLVDFTYDVFLNVSPYTKEEANG